MKYCKQCGSEIENIERTFCNTSCSAKFNNTRRKESGWTHSTETIERLRESGKRTGKRQWANATKNPEILLRWKASLRRGWKKKYDALTFDELSLEKKRERVIEEQNGCCADCGLSEWKGNPITLELDHKDGINDNNTRENLWAICPNCHSYTETWRGRNKPRFNGETKVSDEVLLEALKAQPSIRKALLSVGLAGKGGNYVRAKRLLETITTVP